MTEHNEPSKGATLLPCPFCGSPASINQASNDPRWWVIRCTDQADDASMACRACPEVQEDNREMAIVHWNHREPSSERLRSQVEQMREQNEKLMDALVTWKRFWDTMPKGQMGKLSFDVGLFNQGFIKMEAALKAAQERAP
jgi:hypothetical protein